MIIANDTELRKYIPKVLATVEGEASLFDKLTPFLVTAEEWLSANITAGYTAELMQDATTADLVRRLVTAHALMLAVPSLDVVLTPNGFGIVSTDRIAPASKERVERLIAQLEALRDGLVTALIPWFNALCPDWAESTEQGRYWYDTLFHTPEVCRNCGVTAHLLDGFRKLRPRILSIQNRLANEFFSPELVAAFLADLRRPVAERSALPPLRLQVLASIRSLILDELSAHPVHPQAYYDLVNTIRNNPTVFPEWQGTATAALFAPKVFVNKKKNCGYWF